MHISEHRVVEPELGLRCWTMYDEAFALLRIASPHRQNLYEHEFYEEMADERITKFILWSEDEIHGLSLLANDLEAAPWVSPAYFAHRYPDYFAQGRIFYCNTLLVARHRQRTGDVKELFAAMVRVVLEHDGIGAFDVAGVNDRIVPGLSRRAMEQQAGAIEMEKLDSQHYYAYRAAGGAAAVI